LSCSHWRGCGTEQNWQAPDVRRAVVVKSDDLDPLQHAAGPGECV
jgi:hypothetical protein